MVKYSLYKVKERKSSSQEHVCPRRIQQESRGIFRCDSISWAWSVGKFVLIVEIFINLKVSISFETIETIDTNKDHETNRDLLTNKDLENKKGIFKPCLLMSERNIITFYQFRRSVKDYWAIYRIVRPLGLVQRWILMKYLWYNFGLATIPHWRRSLLS